MSIVGAIPSGHEHLEAAFAAEGCLVRHVDLHVRRFLAELNPLINSQAVLANMGGGGHLADKLDEMRRRLVGWRTRRDCQEVTDEDGRVSISLFDRHGEAHTTVYDLFDELIGRYPELRKLTDTLRRLLPAPDLAEFDSTTVIVGVDTPTQRALLPADVRCFAIAGSVPPWATEADVDLHVIGAGLSREEQAAAAVEAVRGLVTA